MFLPDKLKKSHAYKTASKGGLFNSNKLLKDIVPKEFKKDPQGFSKHLLEAFKQHLKF